MQPRIALCRTVCPDCATQEGKDEGACAKGQRHRTVVVVCLSVRLSVTRRCSTTTAKRRIVQSTPGTLVFWCQISRWNFNGVIPNWRRQMQVVVG